MAVTMRKANAARKKVSIGDYGCIGVGLGRIGDDYVVTLRFDGDIPDGIPTEINGVPLVPKASGHFTAQDGG